MARTPPPSADIETPGAGARSPIGTSCLLAITLASCAGGSPSEPRLDPSIVRGLLVAESFPSPPLGVRAETEAGGSHRASVGEDHAFSLPLPSGHRYQLYVETADVQVRLVFPRNGRVDTAFRLSTSGARLDLGSVRYVSDPARPIELSAASCVDGLLADGATLCTDEWSRVPCADGFPSAPVTTCNDREIVLGYGTLQSAAQKSPADSWAVPAFTPPCEVRSCQSWLEPSGPVRAS